MARVKHVPCPESAPAACHARSSTSSSSCVSRALGPPSWGTMDSLRVAKETTRRPRRRHAGTPAAPRHGHPERGVYRAHSDISPPLCRFQAAPRLTEIAVGIYPRPNVGAARSSVTGETPTMDRHFSHTRNRATYASSSSAPIGATRRPSVSSRTSPFCTEMDLRPCT